jgi:hypothetical protein
MYNTIPTINEIASTIYRPIGMSCNDFAIELAKKVAEIHCEAQLKAILEQVYCDIKLKIESSNEELESGYVVGQNLILPNKDSIKMAYPLDNIK